MQTKTKRRKTVTESGLADSSLNFLPVLVQRENIWGQLMCSSFHWWDALPVTSIKALNRISHATCGSNAEQTVGRCLLFGSFCWFNREVCITQCPLNQRCRVRASRVRVDTHVGHQSRDIAERWLESSGTLALWNLQFTTWQYLQTHTNV